jgi:hypothetical protein
MPHGQNYSPECVEGSFGKSTKTLTFPGEHNTSTGKLPRALASPANALYRKGN